MVFVPKSRARNFLLSELFWQGALQTECIGACRCINKYAVANKLYKKMMPKFGSLILQNFRTVGLPFLPGCLWGCNQVFYCCLADNEGLMFLLKINLVIFSSIGILALFNQFAVAVNIDMKILIQFQHTFKNPCLFFYRIIADRK